VYIQFETTYLTILNGGVSCILELKMIEEADANEMNSASLIELLFSSSERDRNLSST